MFDSCLKGICSPRNRSVICKDFHPLRWICSEPFCCSSSVSYAVHLPASHMNSFFSPGGRRMRRLLTWHVHMGCACTPVLCELLLTIFCDSVMLKRQGCRANKCKPGPLLLSSKFCVENLPSPGCLGNNIGTAEWFGVVLYVLSQLWDQGRPEGTCIHLAWCGMPVPNGSGEEMAIRRFSPSPLNLLLTLGN